MRYCRRLDVSGDCSPSCVLRVDRRLRASRSFLSVARTAHLDSSRGINLRCYRRCVSKLIALDTLSQSVSSYRRVGCDHRRKGRPDGPTLRGRNIRLTVPTESVICYLLPPKYGSAGGVLVRDECDELRRSPRLLEDHRPGVFADADGHGWAWLWPSRPSRASQRASAPGRRSDVVPTIRRAHAHATSAGIIVHRPSKPLHCGAIMLASPNGTAYQPTTGRDRRI